MKTLQLIISGKVQGVSYRYWFSTTAQQLGIQGWVRNLSNGNVEAVIQGEEQSLKALIESAHEGPTLASVDEIVQQESSATNLNGFEILATK